MISLGASIQTSPNPIPTQKLCEKIIGVKFTKSGFSPLRRPIRHSRNTNWELIMTFEYRPPPGLITGPLACGINRQPDAFQSQIVSQVQILPQNLFSTSSCICLWTSKVPQTQHFPKWNSCPSPPNVLLVARVTECVPNSPSGQPSQTPLCALNCCILRICIKSLHSCHSPLSSLCQACHHASPGLRQGPPNWSLHTSSPLLNTLSTCQRDLFKTQDFILWLHH